MTNNSMIIKKMPDTADSFDSIMSLPLFQGMSRDDLKDILSQTTLIFTRKASRQEIVREGTPCSSLTFILTGTIELSTPADDRAYTFKEYLKAPAVIGTDRIFGLTQQNMSTVTTATECTCLTIGKAEIIRLYNQYSIFRINILNIIATKSQKSTRWNWKTPPATTEGRILRFFETHSTYHAGHKILFIKRVRFAEELNCEPRKIAAALRRMQEKGFVTTGRGRIEMISLEKTAAEL